jgi:hypothetical protein
MSHARAYRTIRVISWAEPCSAKRRDGKPCQARAVPGGFVCKVHGGGAPQVRALAKRRLLEEAVAAAMLAWAESGSVDDLYRIAEAENTLREFLAELGEARAVRRAKRNAAAAGRAPVALPPRNPDGSFRRRDPAGGVAA